MYLGQENIFQFKSIWIYWYVFLSYDVHNKYSPLEAIVIRPSHTGILYGILDSVMRSPLARVSDWREPCGEAN